MRFVKFFCVGTYVIILIVKEFAVTADNSVIIVSALSISGTGVG